MSGHILAAAEARDISLHNFEFSKSASHGRNPQQKADDGLRAAHKGSDVTILDGV